MKSITKLYLTTIIMFYGWCNAVCVSCMYCVCIMHHAFSINFEVLKMKQWNLILLNSIVLLRSIFD